MLLSMLLVVHDTIDYSLSLDIGYLCALRKKQRQDLEDSLGGLACILGSLLIEDDRSSV